MTDDIKGSVTFDHKDTVAFARMREDVPHVGMHVFSIKPWELVEGADSQSDTVQTYPYTYKDAAALFAKYPGKIKATANLIKKSLRDQNGGIQVLTNAAPVPGKYKGYQLAVQIDFTLHQFILFGKQFSLERLKSVIEEWQQEGFAVHLLLNTSSAPNTDKLKNDSRGNPLFWSNENWSALRENKDVYYGGEFIPYRPCLTAKEGQRPCIYDTIVSSFLKPTIDYLVESKVAEKLAVIYIFNEFDYPGPVNPKVRPGSLEDLIAGKMPSQEKNVENWKTKWASRKEICGGLSAADCRAQSLANTTKRALAVARTASKGKVPIGVKLIDFSIYSAYNSLLLRKELLNDGILADPTQGDPGIVGVIGVDCYWHKKT